MIAMENIIDNEKSLLTIIFNADVMKHLKCKCDDYVIVFQSNFNPSYFLMAKSDNGYRIRRYPKRKKIYQVNIGFKFSKLNEFPMIRCTYFLKKNNTVRIFLKINTGIQYE